MTTPLMTPPPPAVVTRTPITIVERKPLTVMGLRIRTRPMSPDIAALWPLFDTRMREIEHPTEPGVFYGVMQSVDGLASLDYWAAVAVGSAGRTPPGMESLTLPAGHYACFTFPFAKLAEGFGEVFERLLPASNYEQVPGPSFERYNPAFDPANPRSPVQVCVPVQRRGLKR